MQKIIYIVILALISLAGNTQEIQYPRSIVQKLSSPELKGRGYVENGDKLSADYISAEFRKLGLIPVYEKNYYQKFRGSANTFPDELSVRINGKELIPGKDFIIEASSPSIHGRFRIIKTERNQISTEAELAALINKGSGSFIMIDNRSGKDEKPEARQQADNLINKMKYNSETDIKGIIICSPDKLTWEASTEQGPRPIITINKDFDLSSAENIELTIEAKFLGNYETQNIIGYLKGTSDSDSMIVLMAHYDHLGKMGKNTYFPGANDNASGVAMILSLAKFYSINRPKYTTVFIALSAEELGILGAKAFTDDPPIDLRKIKFLVNFDLAGTGDEGVKVVNGSVFKDKFDLLSKINSENNLVPKVDTRGAACNSDHCPFYRLGVPCFYIYTLGGIQAYHDIYDKYDTLPFTAFSGYCKLMIEFLKRV